MPRTLAVPTKLASSSFSSGGGGEEDAFSQQRQWLHQNVSRSSFFLMLVTATLVLNMVRMGDFTTFITSYNSNDHLGATTSSSGESITTERLLAENNPKEEEAAFALLQEAASANTNPTQAQQQQASSTLSNSLPTCPELMQMPHSPYKDGSFLTRHTIPISWHPRVDGSRELRHSMCQLHRYTAKEAKQCLAGKHVSIIGDSLSRYQYMSLIWFLHKGTYPPHFGRPIHGGECEHVDEKGHPTCSPEDDPNICMEGDWFRGNPVGDPWRWLMQSVGGLETHNVFDGQMEANAIRTKHTKDENVAENYMYKSRKDETTEEASRFTMTYFKETGWNDDPRPINGFEWTGCATHGNCTFSNELSEHRLQRGMNQSWDWIQPLSEAAAAPDGVLYTKVPPIDWIMYNRGLWGTFSKPRAIDFMPKFHALAQGEAGRCYYRATTGKPEHTKEAELSYVKFETNKAGCGYIDFAHLVADFNEITFLHPQPPRQNTASGELASYSLMEERGTVYWDAVHFMPWVYEELNNMLLNIWCNTQLPIPSKDGQVQTQ